VSKNSRRLATQILLWVVVDKKSLTTALDAILPDIPNKKDRAFIQAMCFGTLRWYFRLDFILSKLLKSPLKPKDKDIHILALLGLFQLGFTRVKPHAAVNETVAAVGKKTWAKPLLNGLLRHYQRELKNLNNCVEKDQIAKTAHPAWLVSKIIEDWPDQSEQIFKENNRQPPMAIRINQSHLNRETYLERLKSDGIEAIPLEFCAGGLCLNSPIDIEALPGFADGTVSVQDSAAQQAAILLDPKPGNRVLDVCAAPGGKTLHITELCANLTDLIAIDINPTRLDRIRHNLERSGSSAKLLAADATDPSKWWDGRLFDRILLDAPCSATGVIRRHPDIKLLRRPEDITAVIKLQQKLLESVWPMLAHDGILVYSTCSILKLENECQILRFLNTHNDAKELPIETLWGFTNLCGRQIFPGDSKMDGFFYARLTKQQ